MKRRHPDREVPDLPPAFSFDEMRFRQVTVVAHNLTYHGQLLGADDEVLYLKGRLRYLLIPLDRVSSVKLDDERRGFDRQKMIGAEFYLE
ncbi:MAG: hypothetical protein JXR96_00760 [Deltaproteobacteria bacterium]|nr:hypothetical protein [Deltaproteobacteria bacterium]